MSSASPSLVVFFPPLLTDSLPSSEPLTAFGRYAYAQIVLLVAIVSLAILLWDWSTSFEDEVSLVWSQKTKGINVARSEASWKPGIGSMKRSFLASRYLAIAQAAATVILILVGRHSAQACSSTRALPFTFSIISFSTHIVMVLRIYGLYGQSMVVFMVLMALAVFDFVVQLVCDALVQPVFLSLPDDIAVAACYLVPSQPVFVLKFLSPSLFHHIVLAMTLWKSYEHLKAERIVGGGVMKRLRQDHVFYVLTICLVNFANVILVLQNTYPYYKLINILPSLCLTQIFLGRIVFSLRRQSLNPNLLRSPLLYNESSPTLLGSPGFSSPGATPQRKTFFGRFSSPRERRELWVGQQSPSSPIVGDLKRWETGSTIGVMDQEATIEIVPRSSSDIFLRGAQLELHSAKMTSPTPGSRVGLGIEMSHIRKRSGTTSRPSGAAASSKEDSDDLPYRRQETTAALSPTDSREAGGAGNEGEITAYRFMLTSDDDESVGLHETTERAQHSTVKMPTIHPPPPDAHTRLGRMRSNESFAEISNLRPR